MDLFMFFARPFIEASERQNFRNKLGAFSANCPACTEFDCDDYPFLLDEQDADDLGTALQDNTRVTSFSLNVRDMDATSASSLAPFLRDNPSLQKLTLKGTSAFQGRTAQIIHSLLLAVSQNENLQNLTLFLQNTCFCVQPFYDLLRSTTRLNHLVLAVCDNMTVANGQDIADALADNTSIHCLSLARVHFNALSPILRACKDHSTLTDLNLTHSHGMMTHIRDILDANRLKHLCLAETNLDQHDMQLLSEGFGRNTSVTKLEMWLCEIENGSMIKELIRQNHTLESINLSNNSFNHDHVSEIVQGLYRNTRICALDLSRNQITSGQAIKNLLRRNKHLTRLDLDRNPLQADSAALVAHGLQYNRNLQFLDLSACDLGDAGVIHIAQTLRTNESLTLLALAYNFITVRGLRVLVEAIGRNKTLATLILNANTLSGECAQVLAEMLRNNSTIQDLRLDHCGIDMGDVVPIFEALEMNSTLEQLDLDHNDIRDEGYEQMARSLPRWKGLKCLLMNWDGCVSNMETSLMEGFEHNTSMEKVRFAGGQLESENMVILDFYLERNMLDPLLAASPDNMPLGLWPTVFEDASPSRVFHCLREKPSLLFRAGAQELPASPEATQKPSNASPAEVNRIPNRKRRHSHM